MKNIIFSLGLLFSIISLVITSAKINPAEKSAIRQYLAKKKISSISCTPDRNELGILFDNPNEMIPLPGWGNYTWKIGTKIDSAQFYFDQGINMYYSFHIIESQASFSKAAFLDPKSPMPLWGMALAYGPNINDVTYTATPKALEAINKAKTLSNASSSFEKGLVDAMLLRYSADTSKKRKELDIAYARSMKELYDKNPANPDAGALYADALILLHPWDLYDHQQQPKAWTPEIVNLLENILKTTPNHPAANHYYIHAVEASFNPNRALGSADKLGTLLPKVSHMVHMPSHIYIRTGNFEKGILVNKNAIEGYRQYHKLLPSVEGSAFLYLFHNFHMQATCALNNGIYTEALASSRLLKENIPAEYLQSTPPDAEYLQFMYMTKLFTHIRYGKWEEILKYEEISDSLIYAKILLEFGRGFANARLHNQIEARSSLQKIEQLMKANQRLKIRMGAFNTAYAGGEISAAMLKGIIAEEENNLDDAIQWLTLGVKLEDQMIYDEPKNWILPVRQFLASVYLKKGLLAEAESVLRKDLIINPQNGWTLTGLWVALKGQGKIKEANEVKMSLELLGIGKDFNKTGPVF